MLGWLITNKYVISQKFPLIKESFFASAKKHNIELIEYNNFDILKTINSKYFNCPDFILFWDKDIKLASFFENIGIKVFNSSESIKICDDKSLTYLKLLKTNIKQPKTLISPLIYNIDFKIDDNYIDTILNNFEFPFIIKECFGSFGQQVYMVKNENELRERILKLGIIPYIIQEFVSSSFGQDLRIYIVGDDILGGMKRINKNGDFRANIEIGSSGEKYEINKKQKDIAMMIMKQLGLSFGGVDLLFGEDDEPILCEVNSNAYFTEFNKVFDINVEDKIIELIIKECG